MVDYKNVLYASPLIRYAEVLADEATLRANNNKVADKSRRSGHTAELLEKNLAQLAIDLGVDHSYDDVKVVHNSCRPMGRIN